MSRAGPPDRMRDHWWWRPGWRAGRRMYTWHVTFDDQPQLHELVRNYQAALAPLPGLDLVPMCWLHLTMQGIAFTDEVSLQDVADIAEATRKRLATQQPVALSVGPAAVDPEAIMLDVSPAGALDPVRTTIRTAIADVEGAARVPEPENWTPHISVAYSNSDGTATPYAEALSMVTQTPINLTVSAVHLIELSRDTHLYRWTTKVEALLSG
jgi:2'-5' RNA ligase